jgi:hypothetical protein
VAVGLGEAVDRKAGDTGAKACTDAVSNVRANAKLRIIEAFILMEKCADVCNKKNKRGRLGLADWSDEL